MPISLIQTRKHNSFNAFYFENFLQEWFNTKDRYIEQRKPNPNKDVLLWGLPWQQDARVEEFMDCGGRVIIDSLWESELHFDLTLYQKYRENIIVLTLAATQSVQGFKTISIPEFFWYNDCYWYRAYNYHLYRPRIATESRPYRFFMPVSRLRKHRKQFMEFIEDKLDCALWSCRELGRELPGDPEDPHKDFISWFQPQWYDDTWFSVVIETLVDDSKPLHVSEKTWKPIAHHHPFMVLGQSGILSQLHRSGFETFPELFDETYDFATDVTLRIENLAHQIDIIDTSTIQESIVQEKLKYNRERFYDVSLVDQRLRSNLINPLMEFLHT